MSDQSSAQTNSLEEFKKLSVSFADLKKQFETVKADMDPNVDEKMSRMMDSMYNMINNVHNRISYLSDNVYGWQYQHSQGHIPQLTAGQLQKMLDVCGADEDYQIHKKSIFARKTRNGVIIEATYTPTA